MAGIYHNAELGVISMSSDGENWLTIADKNLGATQVYNNGDTLSEANSGKYYQWGNNHGFPFSGSVTTSSTRVDASAYGYRLGYYESSTFIIGNNDWSSVSNDNLRGGISTSIEDKRGPSPEGFHIPTTTEWQGLKTIIDNMLGNEAGSNWRLYLHIPFAGYRAYTDASLQNQGSYGYYWSSSPVGSNSPNNSHYFILASTTMDADDRRTFGFSIRCFKDSFELPTSSWTVIYGTLGGAGIFWNQTDGIISITSGGTTGYTIQDKNLGATTVFNYGDTLSEANSGKYYQRGNNYGFPFTGSVTTSSTQVDASQYGPTVYYDSDVYIIIGGWDTSNNANLWGGVTNTNISMIGPCDDGYHIPPSNEMQSIISILSSLGLTAYTEFSTYLKLPLAGYRYQGVAYEQGNIGQYWGNTNSTSSVPYIDISSSRVVSTLTTSETEYGFPIRPFVNEPIIPDYTWTRLYGDELPSPKNYIKRFQNNGNYYYFGEPPIHASGVTLNKSSLTLIEAGQTEQLVATVTPSDAVEKSVTWTSSDTTVAKVYQDGTVECVIPGDCTITCTVNDGGYTASCDVTNKKNIDFLLIGGGGGGAGGSGAGGGGAGGFIACNNYKISDGNYRIHIGYGGSGSQCNGYDGDCSTFGNFTAYGGGGGGYRNCNGCPGGSGGGGGLCCCGGGGCSKQGFAGGNASTCYCGGGGGGGGAAGYGGYGSYSCGGYGGTGKYSDISGQGQWYAGGGSGISVYGASQPACAGGTNASNNECCYAKATICGAGGGAHSIQNIQYGGGGCGLFIVRYKTSCGYNITGGTCYTCGDYTIHCFEYTNSVYRQYLCIN